MRQKQNNYAKTTAQKEIYKTLIYSGIFNYPLTSHQIYKFLGIKISMKKFLKELRKIPHSTFGNNIYYYFLPKKENLVLDRIKKEKISKEKLKKALKISKILSLIPTIQFIGISGSLALNNSDKNSDTDLFFISYDNTIWLTRFFVYLFLYFLGLKRNKNNTSQSFCANMFIDENFLKLNFKKRNLYAAREIVQLKPLINRNKSYEKFISANSWIKIFFPNIIVKRIKNKKQFSFWKFLLPLEMFVEVLQLLYMKNKKTTEITTPTLIAFHPIDYEGITLTEYKKRLKAFGI